MPEPFKNVYNPTFFKQFTHHLTTVVPAFDTQGFLKTLFDNEWEAKELKERMRHTTLVLRAYLPNDFETNVTSLLQTIDELKAHKIKENSIEYMFIPDFIEQYGMDDFQTSVRAFEEITQFTSCEFGVRPFLIKYPAKMMSQMLEWSKHEQPTVRRLASEGSRPRLPWGMALPFLKKDPAPLLPILENLKKDPSESVRRSVANNLNDISKDHPETVVNWVGKWKDGSKEIDWLIKHGCRTLLKDGRPDVLAFFGFGTVDQLEISDFEVHTPKVAIGESLAFSCRLQNKSDKPEKIRLEYGIYYLKANGSLSRKVFKISEKTYEPHIGVQLKRQQPFKLITTRKFHVGLHQVALIINGKEYDKHDFELVD